MHHHCASIRCGRRRLRRRGRRAWSRRGGPSGYPQAGIDVEGIAGLADKKRALKQALLGGRECHFALLFVVVGQALGPGGRAGRLIGRRAQARRGVAIRSGGPGRIARAGGVAHFQPDLTVRQRGCAVMQELDRDIDLDRSIVPCLEDRAGKRVRLAAIGASDDLPRVGCAIELDRIVRIDRRLDRQRALQPIVGKDVMRVAAVHVDQRDLGARRRDRVAIDARHARMVADVAERHAAAFEVLRVDQVVGAGHTAQVGVDHQKIENACLLLRGEDRPGAPARREAERAATDFDIGGAHAQVAAGPRRIAKIDRAIPQDDALLPDRAREGRPEGIAGIVVLAETIENAIQEIEICGAAIARREVERCSAAAVGHRERDAATPDADVIGRVREIHRVVAGNIDGRAGPIAAVRRIGRDIFDRVALAVRRAVKVQRRAAMALGVGIGDQAGIAGREASRAGRRNRGIGIGPTRAVGSASRGIVHIYRRHRRLPADSRGRQFEIEELPALRLAEQFGLLDHETEVRNRDVLLPHTIAGAVMRVHRAQDDLVGQRVALLVRGLKDAMHAHFDAKRVGHLLSFPYFK